MWILISLILISLAVISILIFRKVKKIRRLETNLDSVAEEKTGIPKINFISLKNKILASLGKWMHVLILILLKIRIKTSYFLKKKKEVIMPKVKKVVNKALSKGPEKQGVVSKFLKNVSEYKKKLKKIEENMKKEEGLDK